MPVVTSRKKASYVGTKYKFDFLTYLWYDKHQKKSITD